ncbi:MAG: sigma-70 family RNA polymerase sigma factor [Ruminococcus sp.]|nr:sigma-70 family RNA polymerase sigma factor [Ruminococcus sp.]
MTNEEIKKLLRSSPHEAHRLIFTQYGRYVYTIVFNRLRSCGTAEDIEECVSDVFADVFFALQKEEVNDIQAYTGTVAKRVSIDWFRRLTVKNRHTVSIEDEDITNTPSGESVEQDTEKKELQRVIVEKIRSLGEPDSTILIRKFYYGRTSAQIAKELSMTASAVRSRCSRAMDKLRSLLDAAGITN